MHTLVGGTFDGIHIVSTEQFLSPLLPRSDNCVPPHSEIFNDEVAELLNLLLSIRPYVFCWFWFAEKG
jgi:hypothetical protein